LAISSQKILKETMT